MISYTAGLAVSYVLNKRYTFAGGGRDRLSREIGAFLLLNLIALGLSTAAVAAVVAIAGNRPVLLNGAKLAAGAATWVFKYVAFRRWVYPRHETTAE